MIVDILYNYLPFPTLGTNIPASVVPTKPSHHFSSNPPSSQPIDERSLRDYRLREYQNGPESVPFAYVQSSQSRNDQATHKTAPQAALVTDMDAILTRLG